MSLRAARLALAAVALCALAAPAHAAEKAELDAVHHTADGYYLDFLPFGKVELPRILLVRTDEGGYRLDTFASTESALRSGRYYGINEDYASEAGTEGTDYEAAAPLDGLDELGGEVVSDEAAVDGTGLTIELIDAGSHLDAYLKPVDGDVVVDFSVTRHLLFILLGGAILLALLTAMAGRYKQGLGRTEAPRGVLQNIIETLVVFVRDEIAKPNIGPKYPRFLPYLLTVFFLILTLNLLGLVPWGATATSNISVTVVLALATFILTQFAGTRDYWMHIFWPPGVPTFVKFILIPVEFLGLFTKPFALAIRLFANLTAGHLIILNLIGLIFVITNLFGSAAGFGTALPAMVLTTFVYCLEVLVAFIQAYVFTMLSSLFIGMASAEHEHEHDPAEGRAATTHDVAVARSTGDGLAAGDVEVQHGRTVGAEAAMSPA